jgi:hypothetical protein
MTLTVGQTTLLAIRTLIRERADMVNSQFITDSELTSYVNLSYYELYDLLVTKYGNNYFVQTPYTFVTDGIKEQYDLPADFFKLLGLDLWLNGSADSRVTLRPFTFADRNRYAVPNFQSFYGVTNLRYRINGKQLWFTPIPSAGQTIQMWYVPRLTSLVLDTDIVDGVSGWEEYIIVDCAIKCMQKEESDVSVLMSQKNALIGRINAIADNRDAGAGAVVSDTQWSDFGYPTGNGYSGSGGAI